MDKIQLLYAVRSFGGWIDRENGGVIARGLVGDPDALFAVANGEIVLPDADMVRVKELLEVPRLCPGYVELAFLKGRETELSAFLKDYGLEQYMKEELPVFLDVDTDETIIQTGRNIWNRTLMLLEEQDGIRDLYEKDAIENTIVDNWCKENGVQLTTETKGA